MRNSNRRRQRPNVPQRSRPSAVRRRRGFFLVVALVVVAMSTWAAYSYTDLMIAYDETAYLHSDRAQAELCVESGAEAVRYILAQPPDVRLESGGVLNNPSLFQAVNIVPGISADTRANFSIVATALDETGQLSGIRYGLQNESARLNLNVLPTLESSGAGLVSAATMMLAEGIEDSGATDPDNLARSLLMGLPGMTVEVADCILDFIDEDDEPREYGAEGEYYLSLPSPYEPKNAPLDSVEELLLVKGVTPIALFGADANRNGIIDAAELQNDLFGGTSASSLGWSAFLTVYSLENNKRGDGTPRINVNGDDLEVLFADLSDALGNDDWASYIVAYRIAGQPGGGGISGLISGGLGGSDDNPSGNNDNPFGNNSGNSGGDAVPTEVWSADLLSDMDLSGGGGTQVTQLLDLIGSSVTIDDQTYASPFLDGPIAMSLYLPALMGKLTTQDFETMPGRINLNECPAELIRGLPMLAPEVAEDLLSARGQTNDSENRQFETWPLVEGIVTLNEMKLLMPLLTAGGDVYRAQVVGYFEGKNASSRAEVVIDATSVNPKVIYWRDLSHLGRGFDKAVLGVRAADAFESTMESSGN